MRLIKNILFALVLPFAATGPLFAGPRVPAPDSLLIHYTDGVRLSVENEPAAALEMFEKALALAPDHDPSLYEAARILTESGNAQKALEYSSRAAALDPDNVWYGGLRARLLVSLGKLDEALPLFEAMLHNGDPDPDNYRMLALLYYRKGRTDDALATLDAAEVHLGTTPAIVDMKRGILLEADRLEEAVALTEDYVRKSPYDEENRLVLAEMYSYQRRDSVAIATLEEVLNINPDNAAALDDLAQLYREGGRMTLYFATVKHTFLLDQVPLDRKIGMFEDLASNTAFYRQHFSEMGDLALTLAIYYAGDPGVVELYAGHAARGGDGEGALRILKTQLENPSAPLGIFTKIIETETFMGRADSVALYSEKALSVYPGEVRIPLLSSSALQYLGKGKEARKVLDKALKMATTDSLRSEIYGAMGTLWHEEGNDKKTFANYEKALRYDRNNALVLNNYAYFLAVEGRDLDRALGMAQRAVKLRENFASYLDTYAWVLYKTGDYAEAKKVMQKAIPLDRDGSAELLIHYGDILWALDEKMMASIYWKRALDAGYEPASEIEERLSRTR